MIVQPISFWKASPPDPLAGFTFAVRIQARGSKIGLWQDTAATVPATIGTSVAAATDAYGTSGITYTQATGGDRPTYVNDSGGKPVIRFNGVAMRLDPASAFKPASIFILLKNTQAAADFSVRYAMVDLFANNSVRIFSPGAFAWQAVLNGTADAIGAATSGYDLLEVNATPGNTYTALNGVTVPQADGAFGNGSYTIGDIASGGNAIQADVIALLVLATPVTGGQRTTIVNYLLSL